MIEQKRKSGMRVLLVAFFSTEGGISKNFVDIGNALGKLCNVYTVTGKVDFPCIIDAEMKRLQLPINRQNPLQMISPINIARVKKFAKENCIDCVLYLSNSITNIFLLSALKKYPQYTFLHNPCPHQGTKLIYSIAEIITNRVAFDISRKVIVASNAQRKDMTHHKPYSKNVNKICVIYLGIQEDMKYQLPATNETIDVLFFGRIEYYKGIDILLQALQNDCCKNVNCTLIGKGNIKNYIGNLDLKKLNVTVINEYMPDKQIAEYINISKVFVLPYREATGTQIAQSAMYYGKPVVATDTGCLPEYVIDHETGIIVPPSDPNSLAQAIAKLVSDNEERHRLGINGKKRLESVFDNCNIANQYLKLMENYNG